MIVEEVVEEVVVVVVGEAAVEVEDVNVDVEVDEDAREDTIRTLYLVHMPPTPISKLRLETMIEKNTNH